MAGGDMRLRTLASGSILLLTSCAQIPPPGGTPSLSAPRLSANGSSGATTDTLLALSEEWMNTWVQKDVERMTQLHGDLPNTLYGIGDGFTTVEWLLRELREKNYWNVSWKLAMVEPRVRILGLDAGLVTFRLSGEQTSAGETKPFLAAFTLVYQKLDGAWKIVHVQDSSRLDGPPSP
jgi:hypothetical protein